MEETKRRRFIIHAVLEGEVDVQDAPPEPEFITVNYTYPKTLDWSTQHGRTTLSEDLGTVGTRYKVYVDVVSFSNPNGRLGSKAGGVSNADGWAFLIDPQNVPLEVGTVVFDAEVTHAPGTGGERDIKFTCDPGNAVISDIRILKV